MYRFLLCTFKFYIFFQSVCVLWGGPSVTAHRRPASQLIWSLYFSFLSKTNTKPHELQTVLSRTEECVQKHGTKTLKREGGSPERERLGLQRGNLVACFIHHRFLRVPQFFPFTTLVNKTFSLSWLHIHALSRVSCQTTFHSSVIHRPPHDSSVYTFMTHEQWTSV